MSTRRFDAIDALRGLALLWMAVFHLGFDLNHFGYWKQDFYRDPLWTWQRTCILSLFLFCAGWGQSVARHQGQPWGRFWRRWSQVAACALLVSAGSFWMYPRSFIYFGVLHGIAVMLLIARLTGGWGRWLWPLGALAIGSKFLAVQWLAGSPSAELFNSPWLNWLGLVTRPPVTEDYVPLIPWLGIMWWGLAAGSWVQRHHPAILVWRAPRTAAGLSGLGRWSLSFYMLHQPIMIGVLMLVASARA